MTEEKKYGSTDKTKIMCEDFKEATFHIWHYGVVLCGIVQMCQKSGRQYILLKNSSISRIEREL